LLSLRPARTKDCHLIIFNFLKHLLLCILLSFFLSTTKLLRLTCLLLVCAAFAMPSNRLTYSEHKDGIELNSYNSADFYYEMQGYIFKDTRVKGPHVNIYKDNRKNKICEAKLEPTTGSLEWVQCSNTVTEKKLLQSASKLISTMLADKVIMREARSQIVAVIKDFKIDIKSGSKGDKDIATRNLPTWESMLIKVDDLLNN
jgi:hypothetical protein